MAFSKDSSTLITGSICGEIKFWAMPSGEQLGTLNVQEQLGQLELIGNEQALVTVSFDGVARRWPITAARYVPEHDD